MASVDQTLAALGITLPTPPHAVANYVPYVIADHLVMISGQLPVVDGQRVLKGHVGQDISLETGQMAARHCAINILAQLRVACAGDWGRVKQCVRLGGFVACGPNFTDHPKVLNGASDLMVEVFGVMGCHARAAVGVTSLPLGACVEVEATFLLK